MVRIKMSYYEDLYESMYEFVCTLLVSAVGLATGLYILCLISNKARYYIKFTCFVLVSLVCATALIPIMLFRPKDPKNALMPAWGLRMMAKMMGLKYRMRGKENIVKGSGCVVLINHQSALDLIVLAELWPTMEGCTVIAKKEVLYLGPFGLASWLWGTIFVDRVNPQQAQNAINSTGKTIRERKARVLMFPEGTRHGGKEMLPFKKGAFHLAIASKVPIQPVVVSNYYFLDDKTYRFDVGENVINILPPISTEGMTKDNVTELMNKTWDVMMEQYKKLSNEVESTFKNNCAHAKTK